MAALTILLVEDDALIGLLLSEMLTELGFIVCAVATTEDEAVAFAAQHRPGLMIVDQHLMRGNGISAMQRIARDGPIPCVFMSGAPAGDIEGMQVLQKPFLEADLIRAIHLATGLPASSNRGQSRGQPPTSQSPGQSPGQSPDQS